ncbi:NADPH-dependent FMN reductase [Phytomonospora endophytica]|uniref:NAD(P)H-dependent FMN reductase n=1 Tax=Phytomonospora endophytica TaxID=714109 RepID=A0A841FLD7_9ACTN|nr:NAD(P)H-dependent oxidoreductase [Phytomonospora endophytica]MBB6033997.1 NAD(P)H-dependent FMN reductase [Phytomonospora endophytica]GIG64482.1 FMN reductase [Phytomonospora endophytica]
MNDNLKLAVIIGSTREGRFGPVPAEWVAGEARAFGGFDVDVVDLLELELPHRITGDSDDHPTVKSLSARLHDADAFIVVTPEYNHSYPASLKAAIDHYQSEWHTKPVGFVSYGGMVGGQRAVEHLRQIFPEVHALTVRDTIGLVNYWSLLDAEGRFADPEALAGAAKGMLGQLAWWGRALRAARLETAYAA